MKILKNIEPQRVFDYFEEICTIPHGSGDTAKMTDYCVSFAKTHNLDYYTDRLGNVIIRKPASKGYETHPTVIIQGHLDMVCEKEQDCDIDFSTDGLSIRMDGDFISADGTTLGGDDGIAVAMALAILEDDTLIHPPLEILFTVDEETGMYGATDLDGSVLKGKTLINIDSEIEGILTVGCAGGASAAITLPLTTEAVTKPCKKIILSGLVGGHSGIEIDKGRINSNIAMGEFLSSIKEDFQIVSLCGGLKDNAIPRYTECVISTDADITHYATDFCREKAIPTDPDITISVIDEQESDLAFDAQSTEKIKELLSTVPNGIIAMNSQIEGLVETSLNLGIMTTDENSIKISFATRSSVNADKQKLLKQLEEIAHSLGGAIEIYGTYPAWEYKADSTLREVMRETYVELYKKEPIIDVIHAGLECGILSDKIDGLDAVSIGPNMFDIHTPSERLSISSAKRTYDYVCKILQKL